MSLTVTILTCDACGTTSTHTHGTGSMPAMEYFIVGQWDVTEDRTICPRCAPIIATVSATLTTLITAALPTAITEATAS
ncbi:hypothetical protein [Marisediminicola sp. LYQ134]|uniref:hypothetical protein n=1 Tax=Marisediminicola sp. LYQ134 TaxID=3391061 RepID=UPI003983C8D8